MGTGVAEAVDFGSDGRLARWGFYFSWRLSPSALAIAIANNGALIELYAKRDKSSWTLVMTRPGGLSCVLVAGEEWNDLRKREEERIAQLDSLVHRREMD